MLVIIIITTHMDFKVNTRLDIKINVIINMTHVVSKFN